MPVARRREGFISEGVRLFCRLVAVLVAFAAASPSLALPDWGFAPPLVMPGTNWTFAADGRRKGAGNWPSPLDRTDIASGASGPGCAALVGGQGIAGGVRATGERHGVDGRAAGERQVGWC